MRRIHLFELGDLPHFPRGWREHLTASLQFGAQRFGWYDAAAPLIAELLQRTAGQRVVDLCSGGTGPWLRLRHLVATNGRELDITFTDRSVDASARARVAAIGDPQLRYHDQAVDAARVPRALRGVRTMFTAFHHFDPTAAIAVLADAIEADEPIAIFEMTSRTLASCIAALLVPIAMLFTTPFMRPWSASRLLWTYVLPVLPLSNAWDGMISSLRTYSPDELRALADAAGGEHWRWRAGELRTGRFAPALTYLVGMPACPR